MPSRSTGFPSDMKFDVITIFPQLFHDFSNQALLARGIKKKLLSLEAHNLRDWTTDNHKTVDDTPYGGGAGMVLMVEPIAKAVASLQLAVSRLKTGNRKLKTRIILFSPRGKQMDQAMVRRWAKMDQLIFVCGRYEGVDERVADHIADEVVSVGPYVLNGGEVAAMAAIEAIARLIPGFMHDAESSTKDDHPQYTKPEAFELKTGNRKLKTLRVPKVLLSGDHAKIKAWRDKHR